VDKNKKHAYHMQEPRNGESLRGIARAADIGLAMAGGGNMANRAGNITRIQ
jgi:hypothetical protein